MSRLTSQLNGINGVGVNQLASVSLPTDRRYFAIYLFPTVAGVASTIAQMRADITSISIKNGGNAIFEMSAAQLLDMVTADGVTTVTNGVLPIYLADPVIRTPTGEESTSLISFGLSSLTLEIRYAAGATANPGLTGLIEYDFVNDPNRAFVKKLLYTVPNASAGLVDFNTLPRSGAYKRVTFFSANITRVIVRRDGVYVFDNFTIPNTAVIRRYDKTVVASTFPVDFCFTNQVTDALEMSSPNPVAGGPRIQVQDFNFQLTVSAGGNIPAVVEQIVQL